MTRNSVQLRYRQELVTVTNSSKSVGFEGQKVMKRQNSNLYGEDMTAERTNMFSAGWPLPMRNPAGCSLVLPSHIPSNKSSRQRQTSGQSEQQEIPKGSIKVSDLRHQPDHQALETGKIRLKSPETGYFRPDLS